MQRTKTQPIGKILEFFFEENPQMADKLAEVRLIDYWNNHMSPVISRYTGNIFIRNRKLCVKLNSPALKNELLMYQERIIARLNKISGRNIIDCIVFI